MIGVFDSGVGGLSVWRELVALLPDQNMLYLADQARVPYGPRSLATVTRFTTRCVRWLIEQGCETIVIACNTASGAALDTLRDTFPNQRFVGTEPAIKPAALQSQTGVIGVLATQTTFASERYSSLIKRFAGNATVIEQACPGWVHLVESATRQTDLDSPEIDTGVRKLLDAHADVLVLGCTHFPFLQAGIQRAITDWQQLNRQSSPKVIIDPASAIARQTAAVLAARPGVISSPRRAFFTTGNATRFETVSSLLLKEPVLATRVSISAQ
jgi:glutamate racemase